MKTLNGLICLSILFLISGCLPDSFTNWNLQPPSTSSSGSGATAPGAPGSTPAPPTSFTYTPGGPYDFNIVNDASATIPNLTPISTGGGQITEGYITFQLIGVKNYNNVPQTTVFPNSLSMDPNTGIISGKPNQFINHNIYTIRATPIGGVSSTADIIISMATKPETIFYPQVQGQTLLLEVSAPQNFQVGNSVTSEKNAKGTVTSVDQKNKIIYISVNCTTSASKPYCPNFQTGDKIDNKSSYFLEQSTVSKVVYGFTLSPGIANMIPVTNPNLNGQQPEYAISPDITLNSGVNFSSSTGQIWGAPTSPLPNTQYIVTVKNVIGQTANANLNIQVLGVSNPKSPDAVDYSYSSGDRVVLDVEDTSLFLRNGKVSNQNGTSGTIKDIQTNAGAGAGAAAPGLLLLDIDSFSQSSFEPKQLVDNGYPYVLAATAVSKEEPILVHQIGNSFSFKPTLSGNLSASDLNTLSWTSNPELPHLCQSIASTPTVYYPENTNASTDPASCTNAHGTCSVATRTNGYDCVNTAPAATWTTSAKYLTEYKDELWFNRRTGEFGAFNPKNTFPSSTFEVTVTSLTGVVLKTTTAISFEDVPRNLAYASDVLLEVDDYSEFDIGDQVTSDGTGVGVVTYKFESTAPVGTPTYVGTQKILVVKATSGVFSDGEDLDNVYPFTFQKGEIVKAKYNNLGIQVSSVTGFKIGEVVTASYTGAVSYTAKGIINYIDPNLRVLWVRLVETIPSTIAPFYTPNSFSTLGSPITTISALATSSGGSGASATITGIIGDNITITHNGATTFTGGMDVSSYTAPALECIQANMGTNPSTLTAGKNGFRPVDGCWVNPFYTPAVGAPGSVFYIENASSSNVNINPANTNLTGQLTIPPFKNLTAFFVSNGATWNYQGQMDSSQFAYLGGFAMANSVNATNVSVSTSQGRYTIGESLFRYNPPTSTATGQASAIINTIAHNPIFYLDRFSSSGIQPVIDSPANNGVVYSINPALPKGLDFNTDTGQITTVAPGPVAATLKNYTVVASNYLGTTTFTFGLGIREVFSITDITNTTGNLSGILHKSGQGYSRFNCSITQDQIKMKDPNSAPRAKNINCLYDVGEGDLYNNGLELQVNVGTDLCTFVEHVPYFFYQQQYIKTTTATQNMEHTGDWADVSCGPGQPTGVPVQYPNGDNASKCVGNQSGVQCDDGQVPTIQRDYDLAGVCYDTTSTPVAGVVDLATCYGDPVANGGGTNRAQCSDGTTKNRTQCLNANLAWNSKYAFINNKCWQILTYTDVITCQDNIGSCSVAVGACAAGARNCTNRTACTSAAPTAGIWTPAGSWVDRANCVATAGVAGPPYSCGGEQINCINGPGKDFIPASRLTGRFGSNLRGQTIPIGTDPITFTYKSPDSLGYLTNLYLANFSRTNTCTPYSGNPYEFDMNTWFLVGKNRNPSTQGTNAPFAGGNGVYAIRCLDGAANIIGQINLLVREWDLDFKAKDGTDVMNFSGGSMDGATTDEFGYPQNSYLDWDNQTTGAPTCSIPTYTYPGAGL